MHNCTAYTTPLQLYSIADNLFHHVCLHVTDQKTAIGDKLLAIAGLWNMLHASLCLVEDHRRFMSLLKAHTWLRRLMTVF